MSKKIHLHPEDIDSYARGIIAEPTRSEVEAHLSACPLCRSKALEAVEFSRALGQLRREVTDMRDGHRIPTDDPATVQVLNPLSPDQWEVRIRDVSKRGMCIHTTRPFDTGAQVKIQRGTLIAFGEVRYCVAVGDAYHAGILLQEVLA